MSRIPDGSVDMILCDLPYAVTQNHWDSVIPFEPLWEQYKRVTKPNAAIVLTASQPFTSLLVASNLPMFRHEWIWQKNRAGNFANATREPLKQHESVLVFSRGGWTYNGQMQERLSKSSAERVKYPVQSGGGVSLNYGKFKQPRFNRQYGQLRVPSSYQFFNCARGLHPTQKPVALFEYLIRTYTNEGETVLDNAMGSGTTAVACLNTGRHYIGFEKDLSYFQIAQKRIAEHKPQLSLLEKAV